MTHPVPSIEQLQELRLPAPVSYWPQTWGWAVLLGLVVLGLLALAGRTWLRWRRDAYRRQALAHLSRLQDLRELPELLKRVALSMPLSKAEQQRVPTLSGAEWQDFLQRHAGGPVPEDLSQRLAALAYGSPPADTHLLAQCTAWVELHRVAT